MTRPLLLDLYCGAGGAAMGYYRAGFDVIGVDVNPQRNFPFPFIQADALTVLADIAAGKYDNDPLLMRVAASHASPPCQFYSKMTNCRPGLAGEYPDLVAATRELLIETGLPYVIENVERSPLKDPIMLCGQMFGRELYRHRLFEASFDIEQPEHPPHLKPASKAGHWRPGTVMSVAGHVSPIKLAREVMDIDWCTRDELGEAIPPYFTEYIGAQLLEVVRAAA